MLETNISAMKALLAALLGFSLLGQAWSFPPAPHHEIFGVVRDDRGHPLSGQATVIITGSGGNELTRGPIDTTIGTGINYSLKVPMDSGTLQQLYHPTALQPAMPFTIRVVIGGTSYVPIEVTGPPGAIGEPSDRTRLDLTLGIDSDGDGMPDTWERDMIAANSTDHLQTLADVNPDDDSDGDGISNLGEYIAGTYAFDEDDRLNLEILDVSNGQAHMRFLALTGRTYRLESSTDTKTYTSLKFATETDAPTDTEIYRSSKIEYVDLYTPVADTTTHTFYVLHVE